MNDYIDIIHEKENIRFLEDFWSLLDKYDFDFICYDGLSFLNKDDNNYFGENITNRETLLLYLKLYYKYHCKEGDVSRETII